MLSLSPIINEILLMEYSNKVVQLLTAKFKKERPALTDVQIKYYIERFEQLKASPKVKEKDITRYSFADLEKVVDSFPVQQKIQKDFNTAEVKGEEVYANNGIEVYLGDDRDKCVRYRKAFQGDTGQQYSWCISRSDSTNLFGSYRYGRGTARIFYFVIDRNKPISDPQHVLVVHVFDDGKYGLSDARNGGDIENLDWTKLVSYAPALANIPQNIFQAKPLTEKEQLLYELTAEQVYDEDLFAFFSQDPLSKQGFTPFELVKAYIELHQHQLSEHQLLDLLNQKQIDLLNLYINIGHIIPEKIFTVLPKNLQYNYARVGKQLMDAKHLERIGDFRMVMMYVFKFITLEEFSDISASTDNNYISNGLINYLYKNNYLDILKELFKVRRWDSVQYSDNPKLQKMYCDGALDYFKLNEEIDAPRIQMMINLNYNMHLVDITHPNYRLLAKFKEKYPGIYHLSPFLWGNNTIAKAWSADGHQFKFINLNGEYTTDGINNHDLYESYSDYEFYKQYFKQKFGVTYNNGIELMDNRIVVYDSNKCGMFITPDNTPNFREGDLELIQNNTSAIFVARLVNTYLNQYLYTRYYVVRGSLINLDEGFVGIIGEYVFCDKNTFLPSVGDLTRNDERITQDRELVEFYNNTIKYIDNAHHLTPVNESVLSIAKLLASI